MSRISYDYEGDNPYLDRGRWERNTRATIASKRGQRTLRELRDALLALPNKRLIEDDFCTIAEDDAGEPVEVGDVCVLGAYALHKGTPLEDMDTLSRTLEDD